MSDIRVGIKLTTDGSGKVTAEITQVKKGLEETGKAAETAASKNKKAAADTEKAYSGLASQIDGVKKAFLAYVSVQAAWNAAKQITATADAWTNLNSRLRVVTGTQREFATALSDVSAIANRYQADINSVGAAYNRLAPIAANMGKSQQDLRASLESVSAALKLSGASTSEASETLRQFGQALSGPTVQMEEMNTIIDSASVLWQGLQRQFPDLIRQYGSLKEAVGKGALSNRELLEATIRLREEFDAQARTMSVTVSGALQVLSNEWEKYIGATDQASESSKSLANGILLISKNMETLMYLPAKMVEGWGLIFEAINKATAGLQGFITTWKSFSFGDAVAGLFSPSPGGAGPSREEYMSRYGVNPAIQRTPDQNAPRFDGINRSAQGAANSVGRLNQRVEEFSRRGAQASRNEINAYLESTTRGAEAAARRLMQMGTVQKKVHDEAMRQGLNPAFALAIAQRESQFRQNLTSSAGAHGVMQLMPGTARRFGVDINNIDENIRGGVTYLKQLMEMFHGDMRLAAAAYNAGENRKSFKGPNPNVPPFAETQKYVGYVRRNYERWSGQLGTGGGFSDFYNDAQNKAFDTAVSRINQRMAEADAARKAQLEKIKQDLLQAEQLATQAEKNAEISIKMAVDPASQEKALKDMADAQQQRDEVIQKSINITTGVQDAKDRLKAIEDELKAAQKYAQEEGKIAELQSQRKQAIAELKGAETAAQTEALKMEQERKDAQEKSAAQRLAAQKDWASLNVEQQRQIMEGLQAEFDLKQRGAEYSQAVMAQYADDQKAAIDAGLDQARTQAATAEAERAQLLASKQGVSALLQERENITANLRDQLGLLEMEKQAALDKLAIDAQQLDYQKQIADWQLQQTAAIDPNNQQAILAARAKVLEIEGQITENAQKQLDVMNAQAGKQAKIVADANKSLSANKTNFVQEQQLELNAFWDQYMGRLNDYASLWQEITGETQNGFSKMTLAMGEYAKQAAQIGQYFEKNPDAFGNMTGAVESLQQGQAALAAMAKTMIALRSNYAEGTQGYQAMTNAAERMMEVQRALQVVEGVLAVIHQASSGDPYTAIPRALGVAAMIASMGVNVGASGGMSNRQAQNANQQGGYSAAGGGVFGDASTKSDSITKALEIVAQNSSADLAYSAGMLRALNNIELAMKGTTNAVIRGVGPQAVTGLGTQLSGVGKTMNDVSKWVNGALLGPIGFFATDAINKVLAPLQKLLFNVTKKITDWGIKDIPQTLSEILKDGFQALNYTEVTTTTKMLGITVSKKAKDYFSALDGEVSDQFTRVIASTADAVLQAGKAFGLSGQDFNDRLKGFVVDFGKFSTKGLKGEELQNAISQMFSSMSDDMARAFMPGLDAFQQAGEGYFETLVRVADGINVASGMLEAAGLKAISYQDIALKQGDVAAEIVRQSIVAFEGIFSTIGQYIDGAVGSAEELLAVYQDLLSIRAMSSVVGLSFRNLSNDMIVAAGGVSALKDSISFYLENFIGAGGVAAAKANELADSFRRLGIRVPESQDAFRQLVEGIDQSTVAGQKLWAQLLKLAPAFLDAAQAAQELADLRTRLTGGNPFAELDSTWKQLWKDWGTVMDGELAMIEGPFNAKIKAQQDAIQGWAQAISTGTASIGLLTGELVRLSIAKAPAAVLKSIEQAIVTLTKNISEWQKKIKEANAAIESIKDDQSAAATAKRQEILQEQGWSLIGSIADMWEKMISGIRSAVASMQDQIDQLSPNPAQAIYNTASGRVTDAYANLNEYRGRMAGMGQATDPTVELGYIQGIQNAIMARYNAELALLQQAQQEMVAAETERLNAELDAWIETRTKALDVQIEAINAALEAEIQAINDALDARIKAQQQADEAVIKSMQKRFDAENKAIQKQFDAVIKARQKEFDAANKLTERGFQDEQKALQKQQDARMKVLTDELDAANRLADAIKSIAEYAQSLKLGANSPLSPEARMTEAQRQYQALLAKANAGDADALGKLAGASDAYLEAARTYYGSSTNYEDIFKGVQQAMESIGGMSAPDPNSIQSRIDALRESQEREMQALQDQQDAIMDTIREQQQEAIDALRETQQEQLDAIREAQQDQVDAVREAQQANIEAMREAAQNQIEAARKAAQDQIDAARKLAEKEIADERAKTQQKIADLADPEKNQAIRDLRDRTVAELQALQQQARDLEQAAQAKADAWINEVRNWMTQNQLNDAAMIAALNGIATAINPGYAPPAFAKGGQALPGLALVGEQGPEIVRFNTPGQVYTAAETRSMLSRGDDEKIVRAIAELKAEMRAVVVTQSNANPKIIEKLSGMEQRLNDMEREARITRNTPAPASGKKPYFSA